MEPLSPAFEAVYSGRVFVAIVNGWVTFHDMADAHTVYMSEDDLGKLFDSWLVARTQMNARKEQDNDAM